MKTSIWMVTSMVVLIGAMVAWTGYDSVRATRVALAATSIKRASQAQDRGRTQERLAAAERNFAELSAAYRTATTETEKPAAAVSAAKASTVRPPDIVAVLGAHPELRPLFRRNIQARMRLEYPPFYRAARLTSEQIQKFEELVADDEEARVNAQAEARAQGSVNARLGGMPRVRQQLDDQLQAAQIELLGAGGYQQLQEFKQAEPQKKLVNDVSYWFAPTSTPFTETQRAQLLNVLIRDTQGGAGQAADPAPTNLMAKLLPTDWSRVVAEAQAFLSPAQVAAVKSYSLQPQFEALIREFCLREGISMGK